MDRRRSGRSPGRLEGTRDDAALQVVIEDVGGTSWWAGVLTTLTSPSGSGLFRFVGVVDGDRRYSGPTFSAPRGLGPVAPQEEWAPGMAESLRHLQRDVEADGWVQAGRDRESWSFRYRRPALPGG